MPTNHEQSSRHAEQHYLLFGGDGGRGGGWDDVQTYFVPDCRFPTENSNFLEQRLIQPPKYPPTKCLFPRQLRGCSSTSPRSKGKFEKCFELKVIDVILPSTYRPLTHLIHMVRPSFFTTVRYPKPTQHPIGTGRSQSPN